MHATETHRDMLEDSLIMVENLQDDVASLEKDVSELRADMSEVLKLLREGNSKSYTRSRTH